MNVSSRYFFMLTMLFLCGGVYAQQMIGMSYNMGFPQGEMKSQIEHNSYVGFGIEGRQFFHTDITFGVSFNWNKFSTDKTIISAVPGASGYEERKIDCFPLLLNLHYYFFGENDAFRPFFGLNAGTYFINNRVATVNGLRQQKNWHFGFAPEMGIMTRVMSDLHLMVMVRYNYALQSGELMTMNIGVCI